MAHHLFIQASNSKSVKKLNSVLMQFEEFKRTLTAFDQEEEANFLKDYLIKNKLVEPLNDITPMLWTQTSDLNAMILCNHQASEIYFFIRYRLMKLRKASYYKYRIRKNQRPTDIFVWKQDATKVSKLLRKKIKPFVLPIPNTIILELVNDFEIKITEYKNLFMRKYPTITEFDLILSEWIIYLVKTERIYDLFQLTETMVKDNFKHYTYNYGSSELKENSFDYIKLCLKQFLHFLPENKINVPNKILRSF